MSKSKFNPLITASVISAVYLAGLSNVSQAVIPTSTADNLTSMAVEQYQDNQSVLPAANAEGQRRYIIRFNEAAVAGYNGTGTFVAIPRLADGKIDRRSPAVANYVNHLKQQQNNFLSALSNQVGRQVTPLLSYQYAINGVAVYLTPEEAKTAQRGAGVAQIYLDRDYFLNTDAGPTLIGANNVWAGDAPAAGTAFGEGVVLGILDSGANFDHPSFAATGDDGYTHTNPLGSGNYLGVCDPTNTEQYIATYTCNDKLIGGYDFIDDLVDPEDTEVIGPEDENGHGSHTASTAGGNLVLTASASGVENIEISGVARHANIIPFDVCYTDPQGRGLCAGAASVASMDQIIADGIVDVVNYSISGGTSPWTDPVSLAFLSATDTGVFVSASAGNSGPGPATLGHVEPWTSSVGASTHNRRFTNALTVTGPDPVPPELVDAFTVQGTGPALAVDLVGTMEYSGNIDPLNVEGCVAFPASSFDGLVAVISRGACAFATKVNNASAAGAIGVVIHNNVAGAPIIMGGLEATTISSVMVSLDTGLALDAFIDANPGVATVSVAAATSVDLNGLADSMAGFSSRGPSAFEYNKPDVTAPGVNILAAFNDNDEVGVGTPAEFGVISGTSMSSPHNAGAAALLKELQPTWSAPEIKSALMLTAVTAGVTKEDGVTPADPFDRGAGRIQVDVASSTGLVMDETAFRFLFADPAEGGDPKTLNVASYKNNDCEALCTFERTFRSVAAAPVTYSAEVTGLTGTVNPASFTAMPGQEVTLEVTIDGSASPIGETSFGELVIAEQPADIVFTTASNTAIPDDAYDGTLATMACDAIDVSGLDLSTSDAELETAITHTWVGDLTVKLQNPNGDILGVMSRAGLSEPADDGTDCCGDSSDLTAASPITFSDAAATSAEIMGDTILGAELVCQDDGICEYSPFPDTVAGPATSIADLFATDPNGTWNVCVGDSGGGDVGNVVSSSLSFPGSSTVPTLHLPLVIIGFPDQPIIAATPTSINEVLATDDGSTDVTLNISNSGLVADLNWDIIDTGTVDNFTLEQQVAPGAQQLTGVLNAFGGGGIYPADTFTVGNGSLIESVSISGVSNGGGNLIADADDVSVTIYADVAGVPAGHPDDGLGNEAFTLTLPVGDPSLDLDGGSGFIGIDILAATGSGIELPAGKYWVLVYPTVLNANIFFWNQGVDASAGNVLRIDPSGLLGGGTDWTELTDVPALNLLMSNELTCGASWLTASLTSDATAPGGNVDVTITLDPTGLAEGVYRSAICIGNDDFDNSLVSVPVTMTVTPSDIIFANGFEALP